VRILVLNQYFYPDRSATSQLLTELCEDLAEQHDVFVVTGRPSYNPAHETGSRGVLSREYHGKVRVARVWSTSFDRSAGMPGRLANYGTFLSSSIAGAFAVARPDVVMTLTDPPPIGLIGAAAAKVRRVPFVLVVKDLFPEVAVSLGALRSPAAIAGFRAARGLLFDAADRVISIGRDMDRRLLDLGVSADRIETIHDWSDGRVVHPLDRPSVLRDRYGWQDRFVVMHSGNVGLSQDLETVIEAADLLRDEPDVLFAIVGDGASKASLQASALERGLRNVEFLPFQDREDLSESLGAADVHLVGLRSGLAGAIVPSKVYGILAAGKPYIAAVDPGTEPALIAEETGCGVRVEPGDAKALADCVLTMRGADLETLGKRGREALESRFDRRSATDRYERVLRQVVADARG
jgi:glycosyltransferase involved in cell wall biosynthesis